MKEKSRFSLFAKPPAEERGYHVPVFSARWLARAALFIALMVLLGYLPSSIINITTMHIPVILASSYYGLSMGMTLGAFFGAYSCIRALQGMAGIMSPIFMDPMVSIVPRLLLPLIATVLAQLWRHKKPWIHYGLSAILSTLAHTVLVMGTIYLLHSNAYGMALQLSNEAILWAILSVCATNGIPEAIAAGLLCTAIGTALEKRR